MTQQLDMARLESEQLHVTSDEATRLYNSVKRENERYKQQCADLGQQVRMLLKELEEARGVTVTHHHDLNISSDEVSSSSQLISEKLVTFRSIEELQQKNM